MQSFNNQLAPIAQRKSTRVLSGGSVVRIHLGALRSDEVSVGDQQMSTPDRKTIP